MRIAYFSDLQMSHPNGANHLPFIDRAADVVVVAGDLCPPLHRSLQVLAPLAKSIPVVYVAGNRDFYSTDFDGELAVAREMAGDWGIHFLERSAAVIDGVLFAGGTLWSDYALEGDVAAATAAARAGMMDHKAIWRGKAKWRPEDNLSVHKETRDFFASKIDGFAGPKVFVTHLAPHRNSIAPQFALSPLNSVFASDMSDLMVCPGAPELWIHGGLHYCVDYGIGQTRILSNSAGYSGEETGFDPTAVVDLPARH